MAYSSRYRRGRRGRMVPMGDDVASQPTPSSTLAPETADFQQKLLATTQNQLAFLQQQEQRERTQKWIAIGVTAAIPVFTTLWRVILGRRRRRVQL